MKRTLAICTIGTVLLACGPSLASEAELPAPIAACIRDNAAKVEQAIPSLTEATNFLVGSICAEPIAEDQKRRMAEYYRAMAEEQRKQCEAQRRQPPGRARQQSPDGEETADPCAMASGYSYQMTTSGWTIFGSSRLLGSEPPAAVALAGRLLLDLRLARQAREGRR
jgi:hypothetical protein